MSKHSAQVAFNAAECAELLKILESASAYTGSEKFYVLPSLLRLVGAIEQGQTVVFKPSQAPDADH